MNNQLARKIKAQNELLGKALARVLNEVKKDPHLLQMSKNDIIPMDCITRSFILEVKNFLISDLCKYAPRDLERTIKDLDLGSKQNSSITKVEEESQRIIYVADMLSKVVSVGFMETMGLIFISETLKKQKSGKLNLLKVASLGSRLSSINFRRKTGLVSFMEIDPILFKDAQFPFLSDPNCSLSDDRDSSLACPATFDNHFTNFKVMIEIGNLYWKYYFEEEFAIKKEPFNKTELHHLQRFFLNGDIYIEVKNKKYIK